MLANLMRLPRYAAICQKYQPYGRPYSSRYTMVPRRTYVANLMAAQSIAHVPGCIVECGVWRGGMSAGIAEVLGPSRAYHLFDSFEGLPPAQALDGDVAIAYQADKSRPNYRDNLRADITFARTAMARSGAPRVEFHKGWFADTLPTFDPGEPIALLRLDGDWYESTMTCLTHCWDKLAPGAVVVVDDYFTWDGCSRAVHRFLADRQSIVRIDRLFHYVAGMRIPIDGSR